MCGIAGIVDADLRGTGPSGHVATHGQTLLHRGPNDEGSNVKGSAGLAKRFASVEQGQMSGSTEIAAKCGAPVFVVGCPRSGTTLLYHMLLSSGGFAVYRAESNVFNLLSPRFGDLGVRKNRQRLMNIWLRTGMLRSPVSMPNRLKRRSWMNAEITATFSES